MLSPSQKCRPVLHVQVIFQPEYEYLVKQISTNFFCCDFRAKESLIQLFCNKTMFRYAKNVRLASFLALTCSLRLSLALSGSYWLSLAFTGSLPVSLWLSMALCDSHSGSHWLSLPLSGILWPSLAHYCSLISRIQSLIGSQGPCLALSAAATLTHFLPL